MADDDSPPPREEPRSSDSDNDEIRLSEIRELVWDDGPRVTRYVFSWDEPGTPSFRCEHDKEKKLFVLTWPDGRVERFRDNPARQLMVEPDPVTGELRPVIKRGEPVYVYLCREERGH